MSIFGDSIFQDAIPEPAPASKRLPREREIRVSSPIAARTRKLSIDRAIAHHAPAESAENPRVMRGK
jgi:hypothetical protein